MPKLSRKRRNARRPGLSQLGERVTFEVDPSLVGQISRYQQFLYEGRNYMVMEVADRLIEAVPLIVTKPTRIARAG